MTTKENKGLLPLIGTREPPQCIQSIWRKTHDFYTCHCGRLKCSRCETHQQKDGSWT